MINESALFNRAAPSVRWIEGFEQYRNERVFERSGQSCCSGKAFTAPLNQGRGSIVFAGFAARAACLSTSIDLSQRSCEVKYMYRCDASASHGLDDMSADESTALFRRYPDIMPRYLKRQNSSPRLPRKFGNGKNAGE
jgi:nicotinamidase-related amidase